MQRIYYHNEADRTNENILRLYVQTFLHMILLKANIEKKKLKCLTQRKLFGKYYHALITHAPLQYRIINGRSANTENEERKFNFMKVTDLTTSNRHADNIILNAFVRSRAREELGEDKNVILKTDAAITKLYEPIYLKLENSIVSFDIIEKYPWEYQALLEKIADYLAFYEFWKEVDNGVQFNDVIPVNSPKKVHHFRSYDVSNELKYVENAWLNVCLHDPDFVIPAFKIKIEDENGIPSVRYLKTLKHFAAKIPDENTTDFSILEPINDLNVDADNSDLSFSGNESNNRIFPKFITSTPKPRLRLTAAENLPSMNKCNKEDTGDDNIQRMVPISVDDINLLHTSENKYGKTSSILLNVLGEDNLVGKFDSIWKSIKRFGFDETYKEIEYQQLKSGGLSVIPTKEIEKENYDSIIQKLKYIKLLKCTLKL